MGVVSALDETEASGVGYTFAKKGGIQSREKLQRSNSRSYVLDQDKGEV